MSSSFFYPARIHHRALTAAGEIERLARATVRGLRTGRLGRLGRLPALSWPRTARREAADLALDLLDLEATLAGSKPPILYLPAVAWQYRYQRPQHLAVALARAGHPVLYVDGFLRSRLLPARQLTRVQGGVHVLRVRVPGRPDPYRQPLEQGAAAWLAATILAGLRHERPLMVLVQLPFWAELGRELARRRPAPSATRRRRCAWATSAPSGRGSTSTPSRRPPAPSQAGASASPAGWRTPRSPP